MPSSGQGRGGAFVSGPSRSSEQAGRWSSSWARRARSGLWPLHSRLVGWLWRGATAWWDVQGAEQGGGLRQRQRLNPHIPKWGFIN